MTEWVYRWHLLIPTESRDTANALWTLVAPAGDPEARTFGLTTQRDGKTYYASSTSATEEMRAILRELRTAGELADLEVIEQDWRDTFSMHDALAAWSATLQEEGDG